MFKKIYGKWSKIHIALRGAILIAVSVILALLIELFFNIRELNNDYVRNIPTEEITAVNMHCDTDGAYVFDGDDSGSLEFDFEGYAGLLVVEYDKEETYFSQNIDIEYINAYGKKESESISDMAPLWLKRSSHNIRKNTSHITLSFDHDASLRIKNITIDSRPYFNIHRVMLFALGFTALLILILLRHIIAKKVEVGFAITALAAGLAIIVTLPLVRVGFDEETHFRNSYLLSIASQTRNDDEIWEMLNASEANHPLRYTDTAKEYHEFLEYLNNNCNYYGTEDVEHYTVTPRHTSSISTFAYVFMALAINIARAFKLGFGWIYIIARLANLLVYVTVMYFAIRILRKGKILMALIGLLPTTIFTASTISYDPVVTSFIMLGMSYVINNMIYDDCNGRWWQFALAACAMGYGCLAKAVYAPLMLMALFIPKSHFRDDRTRRIVKGGFISAMILLILTFILPLLIGRSGGDPRGGDTSNAGQLQMVLSHPVSYAGLLLKSIWSKLVYYTIGSEAVDIMAYLGAGKAVFAIDALLVFTMFTHSDDDKRLSAGRKCGVVFILFATTALIWTALYLAFTPVGVASGIAGVQGRYFIPLLFPLFMLVPAEKITAHFNRQWYNLFVLMMEGAILFWEIYRQILTVCSF